MNQKRIIIFLLRRISHLFWAICIQQLFFNFPWEESWECLSTFSIFQTILAWFYPFPLLSFPFSSSITDILVHFTLCCYLHLLCSRYSQHDERGKPDLKSWNSYHKKNEPTCLYIYMIFWFDEILKMESCQLIKLIQCQKSESKVSHVFKVFQKMHDSNWITFCWKESM